MSWNHWLLVVCVSAVSLIAGCGGAAPNGSTYSFKKEAAGGAPGAPAPMMDMANRKAQEAGPAGGGKPAQPEQELPMERKIIYSASMEITIKDLDATRQEVERIVEEFKGYIAKSEVIGNTGQRRTGTWTLKIPSAKFRLALAGLSKLGVTTKNSSDSQDVTEEFVDVQARLKNLKNEEEILNKLLKEAVRLEDVLKLREQIKNIRGDIERAEGRLKYLSMMSALSTITFTAKEEDEKYVPPTAPAPPTFSQSVDTTFQKSWDTLQRTAESVALFFVALAPWLPLILVGVLLVRFLLIRLVRFLWKLLEGDGAPPKIAKAISQEVEIQ
jgi:hypothetical protein